MDIGKNSATGVGDNAYLHNKETTNIEKDETNHPFPNIIFIVKVNKGDFCRLDSYHIFIDLTFIK
jgi:hypothetical protein